MSCSNKQHNVSWHIDCLHLPFFREKGLTGKGIRIGLLDSGLAVNSHSLIGKVENTTLISYSGFSATPTFPTDSSGHGTFNATLIAGCEKDGISLGIAPESSLYIGKVVDGGNTIARILHGLDWLLQFDLHLLNMPLGVLGSTPIFQPAIEEIRKRGIIPIVAIGNGGAGKSRSPGWYPDVFSIGSFDSVGNPSKFSGSNHRYGKTICLKPDILAPGEDVFSVGLQKQSEKRSGTSMASSIVTGIMALLCQSFPTIHPFIIEKMLKDTCIPINPTYEHRVAMGLISPKNAYTNLQSISNSANLRQIYPNQPMPEEPKKYIDSYLIERCSSLAENQVVEAIFAYNNNLTRESFQDYIRQSGLEKNIAEIQLFSNFKMVLIQATPSIIKAMAALPIFTMASDAAYCKSKAEAFHFR